MGAPIEWGATRDLLTIPYVSEADIRHSLIKGELNTKLRNGDLIVTDSNIDLLQFCEEQKDFLIGHGVLLGAMQAASQISYSDTVSPPIGEITVQSALDYFKNHTLISSPNKLRVGISGQIDYTSVKEAIDYAIAQGASSTNPWEIFVDPGTYIEAPMTIIDGIILSADYTINQGSAFIIAEDPNSDLFTCTGGKISGLSLSGVVNQLKCLIRCNAGTKISLTGISCKNCYSGGSGTTYAGITNHSLLSHLDLDTHSQYLLATGGRAMSGHLDLGGNNITNVTNVDGVDVSSHSSRHNPGAIDALSTAVPVTILAGASPSIGDATSFAISNHQHGIVIGTPSTIGTSNSPGSATSIAASDHIHSHGNQNGGSLHSVVVAGGSSGFMTGADKTKLDNSVKSILMFGNSTISTTTANRYLSPGFDGRLAQTTPIQFRIPCSGTLSKLYVRHNVGAGNGNNVVYTVNINNVSSSITVSMASTANDGNDLTHTASVSAGDLIDIIITKSASIGTSPSDVVATLIVS